MSNIFNTSFKALLLFATLFFQMAPVQAELAWWLTAKFSATEKKIWGISSQKLDPRFEKVSLLTRELVEKAAKSALSDLDDEKGVFFLEKKAHGITYRFAAGVYKGASSEGRFILIAKKVKDTWVRHRLKVFSDTRGFLAMFDLGEDVIWNECLSCGHSGMIVVKKSGYEFEESKAEEED